MLTGLVTEQVVEVLPVALQECQPAGPRAHIEVALVRMHEEHQVNFTVCVEVTQHLCLNKCK